MPVTWSRLVCRTGTIVATSSLLFGCPGSSDLPGRPGGPGVTVFRGATVITMGHRGVVDTADVVIENGLITGVLEEPPTDYDAGTSIVESAGRYLIPGLIDAHVHIKSPDEMLNYLAHGATSVFNMRLVAWHVSLRDAVDSGEVAGPRIFTAGPTHGGNQPLSVRFAALETPEDARLASRHHAVQGYDYIKIYNTIGEPALTALSSEARDLGLSVVGHIPRPIGIGALRQGQDMVAHGEEFFHTALGSWQGDHSPERLREVAEYVAETGASVTPNLTGLRNIIRMARNVNEVLDDPRAADVPTAVWHNWINSAYTRRGAQSDFADRVEGQLAVVSRLTSELYSQGVALLAGTDSSLVGFPGDSLHEELELLVNAGLPEWDALAAATRNNGAFANKHFARAAQPLGVITKGAKADVVLLAANPLDDISNVRRVAGVFANGQWTTADEFRERLNERRLRFREQRALIESFDSRWNAAEYGDALVLLNEGARQWPETPLHEYNVAMRRAMDASPDAALAFLSALEPGLEGSFVVELIRALQCQAAGDDACRETAARRSLDLVPYNARARRALANEEFR